MTRARAALVAAMALMTMAWAGSAPALEGAAPDSELCRSQLELLISGGKLTPDEIDAFTAQCDCLAEKEQGPVPEAELSCTREW